MNQVSVVVIGAGPAGLSTAYYLEKNRIDYVVLEKSQIGDSWLGMPDFFNLVTPNWTNKLPGKPAQPLFKTPSCNEYGRYLQKYAEVHSLKVLPNTEVTHVIKLATDGYEVKHTNGTLNCKKLVLACGYFSKPYMPESIEITNERNLIHASAITSIGDIQDAKNLLIVGKRESAGQIAGAYLRNASGQVTLSYDGQLNLRVNHTPLGVLREKLYFFYEPIKCTLGRNHLSDSFPPMDTAHIHEFLNTSRLLSKPRLIKWDGENAYFSDGSSGHFDKVVLATGYKYESLGIDYPSEDKNIVFAGADHLVDFRSRYLRGISRDAKSVAAACC